MSWKDEKRIDEKAAADRQAHRDRLLNKVAKESQPVINFYTSSPINASNQQYSLYSTHGETTTWTEYANNTSTTNWYSVTGSGTWPTHTDGTIFDHDPTSSFPPKPKFCIMCGEELNHMDYGCNYHTPRPASTRDCTPSCMWCAKVCSSKAALEAHEAVCGG